MTTGGDTLNMKRFLIALILLPLLTSQGFATSIVAVRSPTEIVVAADSMERWAGDQRAPTTVCKIRQFGHWFFAFAGVSQDINVKFKVIDIASQASKEAGNVRMAADNFERAILKALPPVLENAARVFPDFYTQHIDAKDALSAIFFGFEGGVAHLHLRLFIPTGFQIGLGTIKNIRVDYGEEKPGISYLLLGVSEFTNQFTYRNPDFFLKTSFADAARWLVEMEIVSAPQSAGPPVDVVRITGEGAQWIQKKQECLEIQTYTPPKPALLRGSTGRGNLRAI